MSNQKFFQCSHCGNLIGLLNSSGVPLVCCGENMTELVPNTVDASKEKHVPVVTVTKDKISVAVGSETHPMDPDHYITFIYIETSRGGQRRKLNPGETPSAEFCLVDDDLLAVFAYCNKHGLWKTEI